MNQAAPFEVSPLTPSLGAEIMNVGLWNMDSFFGEIYRSFLRYKIIAIRDMPMSHDQLCEFSARFGELMELPYIKPVEAYPKIIAVQKEADETGMGVFGGDWHSDFSFLAAPPKASILYSHQIPPLGGDTLWVNMESAYGALPVKQKNWLEGKYVIHTGAPYGVANAPDIETQFQGSMTITRNNPQADRETRHPAVCCHPETGNLALFINPTYTTRFSDMSKAESEPILRELLSHCTRPEFSCRFRWTPNTLVIWDNRSTMHYAVNDYDGYRRLMYRTTISGEPPLPATS